MNNNRQTNNTVLETQSHFDGGESGIKLTSQVVDAANNMARKMVEYYEAIPLAKRRQSECRRQSKVERAYLRALHNKQRKAKRNVLEERRAARRARNKMIRERARLKSRNFGKERVTKHAMLNPKRIRQCYDTGICVHMKTAGEAFALSGNNRFSYPIYKTEMPWFSPPLNTHHSNRVHAGK